MHLYPDESRQVEAAARSLDSVPVKAPASEVFKAIRLCVPAAAGLFSLIRPGADGALVSQPAGLPKAIFESWLRMPLDQLRITLTPVILSRVGRLRRDSETFRGAQREQLDVLRELDGAGLGEGAAYKVLERPVPWYGKEHLMLALLMERGEHVPARSQLMLTELHEHTQAAVLRSALPLLPHYPIHPQVMAEQSIGYICLSPSGRVIEVNQRACHLVERYSTAAGIEGLRGAVEAFAVRARKRARGGQPWQLTLARPPSTLLVDVHRLAKAAHAISEDTILLHMREVLEAPVVENALPALEELTDREHEIALLLAHLDGTQRQIARKLEISPNTLRTQAQSIYRKLGVHSCKQLMMLFRKK